MQKNGNNNSDSPDLSPSIGKAERKGYLTKKDMAMYCNVKPRTIRNWMTTGKLPYLKIGRIVRFRLEDVIAWLEERYGINYQR